MLWWSTLKNLVEAAYKALPAAAGLKVLKKPAVRLRPGKMAFGINMQTKA